MNKDTTLLLTECSAGIKMAGGSIDDVLDSVENEHLRKTLSSCKEEHQMLGSRTHELLNEAGEPTKEPKPMARGMSWIKTNVKMTVKPDDHTVADLIIDGCNMGVKSLVRYRNQYPAASEQAKSIAADLIRSEEQLAADLRPYL